MSDHEKVTVDSIEGDTVSGTLNNSVALTTSVWVGSLADFDDFELVDDTE